MGTTTKKGDPNHPCEAGVPGVCSYQHKCGKPGKVEVDGHWYCGLHDPIKRKAKQKARDARYHAEWELGSAKGEKARKVDALGMLAIKHRGKLPSDFEKALAEYDAACKRVEAALSEWEKVR